MYRNKSVDVHHFSMIPSTAVPRSSFDRQATHKTTFDAGILVPVYLDEVLPGDTFNLKMTAFGRLATPLYPIMDNLYLDSFFFFVPNRLVWDNWRRFMGQQDNPGDSIDFIVPQMDSPIGGYPVNSLFDYMGLPTRGQVDPNQKVTHTSLFNRAYNLIWNEWFRDENLQNSVPVRKDDTKDDQSAYYLLRRGKRKDYFTSCLPWPQKGPSVTLPLGTSAPVKTHSLAQVTGIQPGMKLSYQSGAAVPAGTLGTDSSSAMGVNPTTFSATDYVYPNNLYADLSQATAATINQLRQSFQIQKLLERDARGGTRYTEIVRAHFGVVSPDARLQRPEYLGGGSTPINISPIAQTSGTPVGETGYTSTPQGHLAAMGTLLAAGHGFTQSFTEHGMILGLVAVRADLTYQQGLRKMWSRKTRYDYYFPEFAALGEQAVLNKEIYCDGTAHDDKVFGYQERWAEYRYIPSQITGLFRSTSGGTLDGWHLAQRFYNAPTLNNTFIQDLPPLNRVLAVGEQAGGSQILFDSFFQVRTVRPLPMFSVPGLIDHF